MARNTSFRYLPSCPHQATVSSRVELSVRQQPIHARISTKSERDRRPIDPPPIIQIKLKRPTDPSSTDILQNPYYFMCANLVHPFDDDQIYTPSYNALSGQTVSSMYKLKDIDDHDGAFFVFGELSIKVPGTFRLKFTLFEMTTTGAVCLNAIFSEPFVAYTAKQFPRVLEPTFLSRSFSDQGARIRIRKDNRHHTAISRKRKLGSVSPAPEEISRQRQRGPFLPPPSAKSCSLSQPFLERASPAGSKAAWPPYSAPQAKHPPRGHSRTESMTYRNSSIENTPNQHLPKLIFPASPPQQPYDKYRTMPLALNPAPPDTGSSVMPSPPLCPKTIRLPPLRSLFQGESVDAAVTMMQLRRHSQGWHP